MPFDLCLKTSEGLNQLRSGGRGFRGIVFLEVVFFRVFKSLRRRTWKVLIQTREAILAQAGLRSELTGRRFSGWDPVQFRSASNQPKEGLSVG